MQLGIWVVNNLEFLWTLHFQQQTFRRVLDAMSHPGSVFKMDPLPENNTAFQAVLAALLDNQVMLADHHQLLSERDWPMLQAPSVDATTADYVLVDAANPPDFEPKLGTLPSPDFSATLVLVVAGLGDGDTQLTLSGPGIADSIEIQINGLHPNWLSQREQWNCAFPLGVDMIFTDSTQIMALPRTTQVNHR